MADLLFLIKGMSENNLGPFFSWRRNTQQNDTKHNGTQNNGSNCDTKQNDTEHNDMLCYVSHFLFILILSVVMLVDVLAECHYTEFCNAVLLC